MSRVYFYRIYAGRTLIMNYACGRRTERSALRQFNWRFPKVAATRAEIS